MQTAVRIGLSVDGLDTQLERKRSDSSRCRDRCGI